VFFLCATSTWAYAGVSLSATPQATEIVESSDDAVIVQDNEAGQSLLISAVFTPSDLGFGQATGTHDPEQKISGSGAVLEQSDARQIPYSLVLALFALVWLVPVSRRNTH